MFDVEKNIFLVPHVLDLLQPDDFRDRHDLEGKIFLGRPMAGEDNTTECACTWNKKMSQIFITHRTRFTTGPN